MYISNIHLDVKNSHEKIFCFVVFLYVNRKTNFTRLFGKSILGVTCLPDP